jgi:hypothetical protein
VLGMSVDSNLQALTGGGHVPALNDLLAPWGIAFGGSCLKGDFRIPALGAFWMQIVQSIAACYRCQKYNRLRH